MSLILLRRLESPAVTGTITASTKKQTISISGAFVNFGTITASTKKHTISISGFVTTSGVSVSTKKMSIAISGVQFQLVTGTVGVSTKKMNVALAGQEIFKLNVHPGTKKMGISVNGNELIPGSIHTATKKMGTHGTMQEIFSGTISTGTKKMSINIRQGKLITALIQDVSGNSDIAPMFPPTTWRILPTVYKAFTITSAHKLSGTVVPTTETIHDTLTARLVVPTNWTRSISDIMSYTTSSNGGKVKFALISDTMSPTSSVFKTPYVPKNYTRTIVDKMSYVSWLAGRRSAVVAHQMSYTDVLKTYKNATNPYPQIVKVTLTDVEGSKD